MRRQLQHTHACVSCGVPTDCHGEYERNDDGFPPLICREFHQDGGRINPDFLCPTCQRNAESPRMEGEPY